MSRFIFEQYLTDSADEIFRHSVSGDGGKFYASDGDLNDLTLSIAEAKDWIKKSRIVLLSKDFLEQFKNQSTHALIFNPGDFPPFLDLPFSTTHVEAAFDTNLYQSSHRRPDSSRFKEFLYSLTVQEKGAEQEIIAQASVFDIEESDPNKAAYAITKINYQQEYRRDGVAGLFCRYASLLFGAIQSKQSLVGEAPYNRVYKERSSREAHRVRRIVLVKSTRSSDKTEEFDGRKIDWKHSWEVMGHWRKTAGVGKNRAGEYVIPGRTWVNPHVKGDGQLIKKTRFVEGKNEQHHSPA